MIAVERLGDVLSDRLGTGPGRWEQQLLGETPGLRRVVSCAFHGPAAPDPVRVVAKSYATGEGERTARVMAAVCAQLAVRPDGIAAVPQPIFYDDDHRLLAQQVVSGRPYSELATGDQLRTHLSAAGAALATLHRLPVFAGPPRSLHDNLRDLAHPHPQEVAERVPGLAARIETILDALDERDRTLGPAPVTLAHRDLHLRQLLRDGSRVWVLDWDLAAATDPAIDLGNLTAYMATKLRPRCAAACTEALLDGYAGYAGDAATPPIARRGLYEAFTYVRLACKRVRLQGADWRASAEGMLTRAERVLEVWT